MKFFLASIIAILPIRIVRIFFYRLFFKYQISYKAKLKPFNLICCNSLIIEKNSGINGYFNLIKDIDKMTIKENAFIKSSNRFQNIHGCLLDNQVKIISKNKFLGTRKNISPYKKYENLLIGKNSIITSSHHFDLSDSIYFGKDVVFGGSGSQIWTHGFDLEHTKLQAPVNIGDNCYIGSRSLIMPGVSICDKVSIGAGTIISKTITESGFYTSSNLVKKSELRYYKREEEALEKDGFYFFRKN